MSTDRSSGRRPPTGRERSYGGLVVRPTPAGPAALVIVPRGKRLLALPKGGADPGESGERTAAREVREETGVTAEPVSELGDVHYWYRRGGRSISKTVKFYLFRHVSGDPAPEHVHEVDEARWIPLEEAVTALAYPGEREIAARALSQWTADR